MPEMLVQIHNGGRTYSHGRASQELAKYWG